MVKKLPLQLSSSSLPLPLLPSTPTPTLPQVTYKVLNLEITTTLSPAAAYTVPSHAPAAAYTNPYIAHAAAYTVPNLAPYAASYTVAGARLGGVPAPIPGAALH